MYALQDYANRNGGGLARKAMVVVIAYLMLVIYVGFSARSDDMTPDSVSHTDTPGAGWFDALYGDTPEAESTAKSSRPNVQSPPVVINVAAPPAAVAAAPAPVVVTTAPRTPTTRASSGPVGSPNGPAAPTIRITELEPQNPRVGYETRIKFDAGDIDGIVRGYGVDWGDGTSDVVQVPDRCGGATSEPEHSFPAMSHTYDEIGDITIRVVVYTRGTCDTGGLQSATDSRRTSVRPYTPSLPNPPAD